MTDRTPLEKEFIDSVQDKAAKSTLSLMIALGSTLGGEAFTIGLNRVLDGQCPDCGQPIESHPDEQRCFRPAEAE
jgi:hypothetical protein